MKRMWNKISLALYSEWVWMKLCLITAWMLLMFVMISQSVHCVYPVGICRLYNFDALFEPIGKTLLYTSVLAFSFAYLAEYRMIVTTTVLTLLSCIIISYHESNGIQFRAAVYTPLLFAQCIAYWIHHYYPNFDFRHQRIQYSIQIIAALYTLAGIAKLKASGLDWINGGELFSIQIMKNYSFLYFDTGQTALLDQGKKLAQELLHHRLLTKFLLGTSLLLEITCFLAVINTKTRIALGLGLIAMHIGIWYFMGIGMGIIATPMLTFFINPGYLIWQKLSSFSVPKVASGNA